MVFARVGRVAGTFAAKDRTVHKPQDRQGPRPDDPALAPTAGGSGDRIAPYEGAVIPAWGRLQGSGGCCFICAWVDPLGGVPEQLRGRGLTGADMIVPAGYAGPS